MSLSSSASGSTSETASMCGTKCPTSPWVFPWVFNGMVCRSDVCNSLLNVHSFGRCHLIDSVLSSSIFAYCSASSCRSQVGCWQMWVYVRHLFPFCRSFIDNRSCQTNSNLLYSVYGESLNDRRFYIKWNHHFIPSVRNTFKWECKLSLIKRISEQRLI